MSLLGLAAHEVVRRVLARITTSPPPGPPPPVTTHDLTRADYAFTPEDDGRQGRLACWGYPAGGPVRTGDYLILRNREGVTRYRIETMDYCLDVDPPTMWMADLAFAPRPAQEAQ